MRFSLFVIASALLFLLVDAKVISFCVLCFFFSPFFCLKDELRIGILHRPAECGRKSKKGDKLKMHYTGTLLSDGIALFFFSLLSHDLRFQVRQQPRQRRGV